MKFIFIFFWFLFLNCSVVSLDKSLLSAGRSINPTVCTNTPYKAASQGSKLKRDIDSIENNKSKTIKSNSLIRSNSTNVKISNENSSKYDNEFNFLSFSFFIKSILSNYMFFFLLSILQWYEIIIKQTRDHIHAKFCNMIDLSTTNKFHYDSSFLNGKLIFTNGKLVIEDYARDNIFLIENLKDFIKIERRVEVYDIINQIWMNVDDFFENYISDINSNFIVKNEISLGKGKLNGVYLSSLQIKIFENFVKINLFENKSYINVDEIGLKLETLLNSSITIIIQEYFFEIIYLTCTNKNIQLRVYLYGYKVENVSLIGRIINGEYKYASLPYDCENYYETEKSIDLNGSTDMKISFDLLNVLFCFCLNDPPYFRNNNDKNKINWIKDKFLSKEAFLNEEYGVSFTKTFLIRFSMVCIIFIIFWFFPGNIQIVFLYFGMSKKIIHNNFICLDLIFSILSVIIVIVYSNLGWINKTFCTMCSLVSVFMFVLLNIFKFFI